MRLRRFRPNLGMSKMMVGRFLGPELITVAANRDFSAGQSNWTVENGIEITWDGISMNCNCTEWNSVRLATTLTEGVLYRWEFEVLGFTSGQIYCYMGGETYQAPYIYAGTFSVNIIAEANNWIRFGSTNLIGSLDNVSIKKYL